MEYASAVWNPLCVGLDNDIEKVQRRFTKRLYNLHLMPYEARLAHLHLPTLRLRRSRADLVIVFKALHGSLSVEASDLGFIVSDSQKTRSCGTDLKVYIGQLRIVLLKLLIFELVKYLTSCQLLQKQRHLCLFIRM